MKWLIIIIILATLVILGSNKINERNSDEVLLDVKENFFQKLSDAKTDCEQRKMNFIGMGINEKGNFESQCYTKSPLKFYKFEIEVLE